MSASTQTAGNQVLLRWSVVLAIALVAFFASYRYAVAASGSAQGANGVASGPGSTVSSAGGGGCCGGGAKAAASTNAATAPAAGAVAADPAGATTGGGGCCGGGATGPATTKSAAVAGDVQTIAVDVSKGYYDPSTSQLKAGVPAEITFSQSGGCTGVVQSQELGFSEDLSGGPKTVKLPALQPGSYQFACGMNMVSGTIVVQ